MKYILFALLISTAFLANAVAEPWRFVVTGDSYGFSWTYDEKGVNTLILGELVDEFLSHDIDCVLFPGDLVLGDNFSYDMETQLTTWRNTMGPLYEAGINVYPVRGNHDDDFGIAPWNNVFSGEYALPDNGPENEKNLTFSALHNNALFVGLDLYIDHHKVNQDWLDAQFAQNVAPHIFVFAHEPAFSVVHPDYIGTYPRQRDIFWQSIADAGGRTFFSAHDHFYNHARIDDGDGNSDNDLHQFVVGTAGSVQGHEWDPPVYKQDNGDMTPILIKHVPTIHSSSLLDAKYGYVLAEVDDLNVTLTYYARHTYDLTVSGQYSIYDTWSYTAVPVMTLIEPNGGEKIVSGSQLNIKWLTNEVRLVESVLIEYSPDEGITWNNIDTVANTGSYLWNTPETEESNQCLVRVSPTESPASGDTSNKTFTLFQCQDTGINDLNNDCYIDIRDFASFASDWLQSHNDFDSTGLTQDSWKFIVTGDSRGEPSGVIGYNDNGVNTIIMTELATEMTQRDVDLVLFTGDLVNGEPNNTVVMESQLMTWRRTMQPVYDSGIAVYAVRGNHDNQENSLSAWQNVFSGPYAMPDNGPAGQENLTYSINHKNSLIIGFDQYSGRLWPDPDWLDDQLTANSLPHVFTFAHQFAFYPCEPNSLRDAQVDFKDFWAALKQAGSRTYFSAHHHFFDHCLVNDGDGNPDNDIYQIIAGTAGAPGNSQYGYVLVEVNNLNVRLSWVERHTDDLTEEGTYNILLTWAYSVPCPHSLPADINNDCLVNMKDLSTLAADWLKCGNPFDPACN